eukprot:149536-Prymnesium_polylepis.1
MHDIDHELAPSAAQCARSSSRSTWRASRWTMRSTSCSATSSRSRAPSSSRACSSSPSPALASGIVGRDRSKPHTALDRS